MPLYYFDTSALLKRYRTEHGTDVLDAIFSVQRSDEFFTTSHFTAVEVESVAARALKGRVLNRKAYGVLLSMFADDLDHLFIVLPVSTALLSEAASVARQYSLRAGDAVHLASALRGKQAADQEVVFVASDKELLEASRAAGFVVLNPENEDALVTLANLREQDSDTEE